MKAKQICRIFEVMFSITHPALDVEEFDGGDDDVAADVLDDGDVENISVTIACEEPLSLCEFAQRLEDTKLTILAERDLIAEADDDVEVDIIAIEDISHTNLAFLPAADTDPKALDEEPIAARLTPTGIRIGGSN